jgi:phytoene synthase
MGGFFYRAWCRCAGYIDCVHLDRIVPQKTDASAQAPPPREKAAATRTPSAKSDARQSRRAAADPQRRNAAAVMQHSRAITKKSASNLALAFILLPRQKRDAMSALYAFCRQVDDVADDETVPAEKRRVQLSEWRDDVKRACENQSAQFPVNRELQPVIRQFHLPFGLFDELIKGCEMDLDTRRYENFGQLESYCYHVASVVGLLSIEIFGYKNPATRDYAIYLGKALQLTNILRDVKTDAARGRIYLPQSELKKFDVSEKEILDSKYSGRYFALAGEVAARAKDFYRRARQALPAEDRNSMVAAELMGSIYWQLLQKLERRRFDVFYPQPVRISRPHKLLLILRSWLRFTFNATSPNYGTP